MKKIILTAFFLFLGIELVAAGNCFDIIKITKVYDGDTILGFVNGKKVNIRLLGIDCYETSPINRAYKQAYLQKISIEEVVKRGNRSKTILNNLVENNPNAKIILKGKDCYNRDLGILFINDININKYMVENGGCLKYTYNGKNQ